ncbi:MAG TPA: 2-C-methyl-D-erythritol 2,4-cyclodiphosphate synthase [Casimicrobiaceae bacterium]|nr:2-C-methyl-D-erythritol 2,4-cyclodiphosphate synthase [Casimicrobiaceae bacterium]
MTGFRIGCGFDVHRLVAGKPLKLGGVTLPFERGLEGHSDADVLLHAICDAILGAIGQGDIGRHFPDSDSAYKGADSRSLLRAVWQRATAAGYALGNVDAIVLAEAPRISPHAAQMAANIAADCLASPGQVNVKATTSEGLGFTGRGEGIAAWATVLLITA